MATSAMNGVIQHIRAALLPECTGLTDGQLVRRFVEHKDQAAFAALVRRHGPMVWGVCRRVLSNHHDAEDAFQAAFIVLARKAASIRPPEMLVNWLYGVAHKTALKAKSLAARRAARELPMTEELPEPDQNTREVWSDLRPLLDQELSRLPDKYRAPLLLCDLEGKTRQEAARQLGWPEGTVAGRLARARTLLAKRLTRRGLALSAVALANALVHNAASATVPPFVLAVAARVAALGAAGGAFHATGLSWQAFRLAQNVACGLAVRKLLLVVASLVVSIGCGGVAWLAIGTGKSAAVFTLAREAAGSGAQPTVGERIASPDAKALLDRAVESVPLVEDLQQRVWILCAIARLQAQADTGQVARETIEKARKAAVEAENEQRMGDVAECQAEIGDINGALQTAIVLDGRDYTLDHIAAIQANAGDFRGALRTAKLVQEEPYKSEALAMITQAQAKARQFQAASKTAQSIAYAPERAGALLAIATEQIRSGDRVAGNQVLDESLRQAEKASEFFDKPERSSDHKPAVLAQIAGIKALATADEDAARIARGLRQPWRDVAWGNIAAEQASRGRHDEALRSAQQIGDLYQRGEAEKNIVASLAEKDLRRARTLASGIKSESRRVLAFLEIAKREVKTGNREAASQNFDQVFRLAQDLKDTKSIGNIKAATLSNLAKAQVQAGAEKVALAWIDAHPSEQVRAWALVGVAEEIIKRDKARKAGATPRPASFRGKIVLFGSRLGHGHDGLLILAMRPDGSDIETILELPDGDGVRDVQGRVAPDGRRLAFSVARIESAELWLLEIDGRLRKIANDAIVQAWSPDGTQLACFRGKQHEWTSFIVDIATGNEQRLRISNRDIAYDWSPDGKTFAVVAMNPDKTFKHPTKGMYPLRQIYFAKQDGSGREDVTTDSLSDNLWPRFSPDGQRVSFSQRRHDGVRLSHTAVVADRCGKDRKEVIDFDKFYPGFKQFKPNAPPCWSPDGQTIVWLVPRKKTETGTQKIDLLFASVRTGEIKQLDLDKLGIQWVQELDWR